MESAADSLDPSTDSVVPAASFPPLEPRRNGWQWAAAITALMISASIVGGMLFRVPYVALVPGTARDTEPLLVVDGIEAYPSEGQLLLTTVRIRQRPNLWEYLWLHTDADAEILSEAKFLGERTPQENRELNLQLMSDSKTIAIAVALEALGYDAIRADGVIVTELVEGAAAEEFLSPGDTLVAVDGVTVANSGDLVAILRQQAPGDEIVLTVEPLPPGGFGGELPDTSDTTEADNPTTADPDPEPDTRQVAVVLGPHPDDPEAAFLGVGLLDRVDFTGEFDFHIDIDSGSVGGPSAGLAFTLAILDELTEGELTGGATVAATGTIDAVGRVGTVGGVMQKTAAVRDTGADVFLVPAGLPRSELDRIEDRAGDDLEVIPVENLDDALAALAGLGGEVAAVHEFAATNHS